MPPSERLATLLTSRRLDPHQRCIQVPAPDQRITLVALHACTSDPESYVLLRWRTRSVDMPIVAVKLYVERMALGPQPVYYEEDQLVTSPFAGLVFIGSIEDPSNRQHPVRGFVELRAAKGPIASIWVQRKYGTLELPEPSGDPL